jgi:hypothetical protein
VKQNLRTYYSIYYNIRVLKEEYTRCCINLINFKYMNVSVCINSSALGYRMFCSFNCRFTFRHSYTSAENAVTSNGIYLIKFRFNPCMGQFNYSETPLWGSDSLIRIILRYTLICYLMTFCQLIMLLSIRDD